MSYEEITFMRNGRQVRMLRDSISKRFFKQLEITVPDSGPPIPDAERKLRYQADHEGKICEFCAPWDLSIILESEIPLFFPDAIQIGETGEYYVNYHTTKHLKDSLCHCLLQPIKSEVAALKPGRVKSGLFESRLKQIPMRYLKDAGTQNRSKFSF